MDNLYNLGCAALMFFIAFVMFDYSRIWWYARRNGFIMKGCPPGSENVWRNAYLGYKTWSWFVRVLCWLVAVWHITLGVGWLTDFAFMAFLP